MQSWTDAPQALNPGERLIMTWPYIFVPSMKTLDGVWHLDTLVEQVHYVAASHQSFNVPVQSLI